VVSCHRVSLPEEDGPKHWPDLLTSPVLAENVGWIHVTCDVIESNDLGGYGLSDVMVGQRVVPLVQSRTIFGAAVDDRLVVSKHSHDKLIVINIVVLSALFSVPQHANQQPEAAERRSK